MNLTNLLLTTPFGTCGYDTNGNLTTDGAGRTFTYDAEKQLTSVGWGGGNYRTDFVYDGRGRMRRRLDYYYSGGAWSSYGQSWYYYDGMRIIHERDGGNAPLVAYTSGQDLSGSFEGAGGIGGLLGRSDQYSSGTWGRHVSAHADGNGNVTALIDSTQAVVGSYRYDPYGQVLAQSGALASANKIRFSTKLWFDSINLYYYGYRFYDPGLQRWLNRDPIGERGGRNLYAFCLNAPVGLVDHDGRAAGPYIAGGVIVVGGGVCWAIACRLHMGRLQGQANAAALNQMQRLDPNFDPEENHPNRQPGNTADALRHCIGSCLANQNPGPCLSSAFVRSRIQAREDEDTLMDNTDRANNQVGFGIGGDCVQGCLNALRNGQLQCYAEGDTEPSPCAVPPGLVQTR